MVCAASFGLIEGHAECSEGMWPNEKGSGLLTFSSKVRIRSLEAMFVLRQKSK